MSIFETEYNNVKKGLILCGAWSKQAGLQARTIRVISIILVLSIMIPEQIYLFEIWGNYNDMIPCLPPLVTIAVSFVKFYFLIGQHNIVSNVVEQIENDWKLFNKTPAINQVMHHHASIGSRMALIYMYVISSAASLYMAGPFFPVFLDLIVPLNESRKRVPPYETNYGVDPEQYFFLIGLHGTITTAIEMTWIWTTDVFIMIMVQHCSSLFNIVGVVLEQLNTIHHNDSENYEKDIITQAIVVHKHAIKFAEFMRESLNKMYGFVFLVSMILMSVTGFHMVLRWENRTEALRMAVFIIAQGSHLFFNTIPSQQLIDNSGRVSTIVYNCGWNDLSVKSQMLIQTILTRSTKTVTLTAGSLFPLNMENYSKILRTSMSYFTVLKSMQ